MNSLGLYWRTLRHLTPRQVMYQVWHRLRGRPRLQWRADPTPSLVPSPTFPITFTFLNQSVTFTDRIDWNYAANGKLWTYQLTYFDWLTSPERGTAPGPRSLNQGEGGASLPLSELTPDVDEGSKGGNTSYPWFNERGTGAVPRPGEVNNLLLIYDFIRQTDTLRDGLEPYPTSLRLLNWRAYLLREGIDDPLIERHLYAQTILLHYRLEYHLGGNHLLENACALTVMALHFQHQGWFDVGTRLLRSQLDEQILQDGGHYERSPMYHQLLTDRLLDVYAALQVDSWATGADLIRYVQQKITAMLNWLVAVTFRDGSVPLVNDATPGVAPTTAELLAKATPMGFTPTPSPLTDSGYRMLTTPRLELFIDIGPVGPDHQPGHAHADTFSFVLHIDGKAVIVDPGTSTYQISERRSWERSTAAHNTVTVAGQNSSEVWSSFRVGRRAQVQVHIDTPDCVEAIHTGYNYLGEQHTRRWTLTDGTLSIIDTFSAGRLPKKLHLSFNHSLYLPINAQTIQLDSSTITFSSEDRLVVEKNRYEQALGFNHTVHASRVTISFLTTLTTHITTHP